MDTIYREEIFNEILSPKESRMDMVPEAQPVWASGGEWEVGGGGGATED